jgi:hypothetical protein
MSSSNTSLTNRAVKRALNGLKPIVGLLIGQSNASCPNDGGPNPINENTFVWDALTGAFGSSDITKAPMTHTNPHGNGGNNNIGVALIHRIQEETGRPVYLIFDAVGGKSIDEWVGNGVTSTRYASAKAKVEAALAVLGVDSLDFIQHQQAEADYESDFETHLNKFDTLVQQLRAETWMRSDTPILVGSPAPVHDRYAPKRALRHYCRKVDARCVWVSSAGLQTSDGTHYTGQSAWDFGYIRYYEAFRAGVSINELDATLFNSRGNGVATEDDEIVLATFRTLVSSGSLTSFTNPNSVASFDSMMWGYACFADANYSGCFGYNVSTHNLASYTYLFGRDVHADESAQYGGGFGFQNNLKAEKGFVSGEGNTVADEFGGAVGSYCKYDTEHTNPVRWQIGIGGSNTNRKNAFTVRAGGEVEILAPSTAGEPNQKEETVLSLVNDTTLKIMVRGSDDVVRSINLTLA